MTIRELIQQLETIENKDINILAYGGEPCTTQLISIQDAQTKTVQGYSFKQTISEDWIRIAMNNEDE